MCSGATGRNGGIWWPFSRLPESEDVEKFGKEDLERTGNFDFDSTRLMEEVIKENNIECDFKKTGEKAFLRTNLEGTINLYEADSVEDIREYWESLKSSSFNFGALEFWDDKRCASVSNTTRFKAGKK